MNNINPAYNDRVRYTLEYPPYGSEIIQEPDNWRDDDKEFARNKDYHGIITQFSNALTFVGNGADYILLVDELYGVQANIRLVKDVRNPQTDLWERDYEGYLDLSTLEIEKGQVKVKFNSGGLEQELKARESEQVEIERNTTMDGATMAPLRIDKVFLAGRRILLNTFYNIDPTNDTATAYVHAGPSSGGTDRYRTVGVPLNIYSKSHDPAQNVIPETPANEIAGTNGIMFFANNDVPRTLHIKLSIDFTTNILAYDDVNHGFYRLCMSKYIDGINYVPVGPNDAPASKITLWSTEDNGGLQNMGGDHYTNPFTLQNSNPAKSWHVDWEGDILLQPGESLALEFYMKGNLGGTFHDGTLQVKAQDIVADLKIIEDSFVESSQSKFVLAYEFASRLIEIMTGNKTALRSDFLGRTDIGYPQDGKAALNGFTHGFWVRGFDKKPPSTDDTINSFKQLTTSWRDFISSMQAVWNVGLGIERVGFSEKIVIEELSYFYASQVTVRLPLKVSDVKQSVATEYYYSGLEFGYTKGGEYSEAMGLDEYNGKSTFTTIISRLKNTYSRLSNYRADSYGKEFARRKPKINYPTEDTSYDNDIFIMDLKRNAFDTGNPGAQYLFNERLWQDDFAQAPTGTYSPETATNLRLSPFNILLRHGWVVSAGLTKYLSDYIRYGSSTANSSLKTKLVGGNEYAENGNIVNSELSRARYVPVYKEFVHQVDTSILQQLKGSTNINGRMVPNFYGLIEFINENNEPERGYLINLKPNEGKFKVLIYNS